jgi:pyridoxamine 5'-phosphate oxidase
VENYRGNYCGNNTCISITTMACLPPWAPLIDTCLKAAEHLPTFTLCTVSPTNLPHARTCVSRGWLFNSRSSGVLVFTTDKRMTKVQDLQNSDAFEACFYFPKNRIQFRLSGFCQILSTELTPSLCSSLPLSLPLQPPSRASSVSSSGSAGSSPPSTAVESPRTVPFSPFLGGTCSPEQDYPPSYFPVITPSYDPSMEYDCEYPSPTQLEWKNEYERLWTAMSPRMKSSFRVPNPRTLMSDENRKTLDSIARGVDGSADHEGKENFLVVLMLVNSVDMVVDKGVGERTLFTRVHLDEWKEQELCP